MKRYTILLVLLLILAGCSKNVVLDNPSGSAAKFTIDGETVVEVGPKSMEAISLDAGKHKVKVEGQGLVTRDTSFQVGDGGILHSGSSNYLVFRQLYGIQTDRATLLNERWVEFDSAKAFGDIKFFPADVLYIEDSWDYGLDEVLPESQTLLISKDFKIESKVYRSREFLREHSAKGAK